MRKSIYRNTFWRGNGQRIGVLIGGLALFIATQAGAWGEAWQPSPGQAGRDPAEQQRQLWYVPAFRGARVYAGPSLDGLKPVADWRGEGIADAVLHFPSGRYWPDEELVRQARSDTKPAFGRKLGPHNAFVVMSGGVILGFVPEDYMALKVRLDKPLRFADNALMLVSKEATAISFRGLEEDVRGMMRLKPKR